MPNTFTALDVPVNDGSGVPFATRALGRPKTIVFSGPVLGRYIVEGSNDGGTSWDILVDDSGQQALFTTPAPGVRTFDCIVDRVRVRSVGNASLGTPPTIALGAPPAVGTPVFGILDMPAAPVSGCPSISARRRARSRRSSCAARSLRDLATASSVRWTGCASMRSCCSPATSKGRGRSSSSAGSFASSAPPGARRPSSPSGAKGSSSQQPRRPRSRSPTRGRWPPALSAPRRSCGSTACLSRSSRRRISGSRSLARGGVPQEPGTSLSASAPAVRPTSQTAPRCSPSRTSGPATPSCRLTRRRSPAPSISALVDVDSGTATFNLRLSATPDVVDGGILATITKVASGAFELKSTIGAGVPPLSAPALIKITAANDNSEASCRIRSKTITLRAS